MSGDWWDRLYDGSADTGAPSTPVGEGVPDTVRILEPRPDRLPDWRSGEQADLTTPEPEPAGEDPPSTDAAEPGEPSPEAPPGDNAQGAPGEDPASAPATEQQPEGHGPVAALAAALDRVAARLPSPPEQVSGFLTPKARRLAYTATAAASGHLVPVQAGHPEWSLPRLVRDAVAHAGAPPYHLSTGLLLGAGIAAATWAVIDRPTRRWHPALAWPAHIPFASVLAGLALWAPAWDGLHL